MKKRGERRVGASAAPTPPRPLRGGQPEKLLPRVLHFGVWSSIFILVAACPPQTPTKNDCEAITIPAVGPGTGTSVACVLPSECIEGQMAVPIDHVLCADKSGGYCPMGTEACSNKCSGVVLQSGLKILSCSWNRDKPCEAPAGTSECTCTWSIPAGSTLSCGCGCQ